MPVIPAHLSTTLGYLISVWEPGPKTRGTEPIILVLVAVTLYLPLAHGADLPNSGQKSALHNPPPVQIQGTIVPIGETTLGELQVRVLAQDDTSATVTSDGSFSLDVESTDDTLVVQVDAPPTADRRFHPALFRAPTTKLESGVTVFMIPLAWTVQKGDHAGETVEVSMYEALMPPRGTEGFFSEFFPPFPPEMFGLETTQWRPEDRPVPVAMRSETPEYHPITEEDSAYFWGALEEMEAAFGRDLFRAATPQDTAGWDEDEFLYPEGAIGILVDTAQSCCFGGSVAGEHLWKREKVSSGVWGQAVPAKYASRGAEINAGGNSYPHSAFEGEEKVDYDLIHHEMLHAMGFGHGCLIPSIMAYPCKEGVPQMRAPQIAAVDVAYWELRNEIFQAVRKNKRNADGRSARFSVLPALLGERKLLRGLKPIPAREEWENTGLITVRGSRSYDFEEIGVDVEFSNVSGTGRVRVSKYEQAPRRPDGIAEENIGAYRLVITSKKHPKAFEFDVGSNIEVRVDTSALAGVDDPSNVTMYRRPWTDRASFEPLETTYQASGGELVAETDHLGEFAFASDSEPLPVDLAGLEAAVDGHRIVLRWQTVSEANNVGFEVQRRRPTAAQWKRLGFTEGAGSTSTSQAYRFVDADLPSGADSLLYRLKQIDMDGRSSYSREITVYRGVNEVQLHSIYPNPTRGRATVRYTLPQRQKVSLRLYDGLGRRLRTLVKEKQVGRKKIQLDVSDLPSGPYFLRMETGATVKTARLTVLR